SRSDVTWHPSVTSVCRDSLFCPTTEEYILPIIHGNDRVEWFVQLTDEIDWDVSDKETGKPRARVLMKAGDVAAMPADIRHQGFATKRSMLLVWENARRLSQMEPHLRGRPRAALAQARRQDRGALGGAGAARDAGHRPSPARHARPRRAAHGRHLPLLRRHGRQAGRLGDPRRVG